MELTSLMLADAARVSEQKLYVHGGGWDRIGVASFPASHPSLTVVAILRISAAEAGVEHALEVELVRDGQPLGPRVSGNFTVQMPDDAAPGSSVLVPVTFTFNGLTFEEPGRLDWVIKVNDEPLDQLTMEVSQIG